MTFRFRFSSFFALSEVKQSPEVIKRSNRTSMPPSSLLTSLDFKAKSMSLDFENIQQQRVSRDVITPTETSAKPPSVKRFNTAPSNHPLTCLFAVLTVYILMSCLCLQVRSNAERYFRSRPPHLRRVVGKF